MKNLEILPLPADINQNSFAIIFLFIEHQYQQIGIFLSIKLIPP